MRLATTCPHCQTTYQVDPSLRGQRMRCPNGDCRAVFLVTEEEAPAAPEPPPAEPPAAPLAGPQVTGSVGDIVPVLSAEQAEEVPSSLPKESAPGEGAPAFLLAETAATGGELVPLLPAAPAEPEEPAPEEVYSWQEPPPVRGPTAETPKREPAPRPKKEIPAAPSKPVKLDREQVQEPAVSGPVELHWNAQPPPLRMAPGADAARLAGTPGADAARLADNATRLAPARRVRRRMRRLVAVILLLLVAAGAGLYFLVQREQGVKESDRYQQALAALKDKNYVDAAQWFRELEHDYPASERRPTYTFLAELSEALEPVTHLQASPVEARRNLEQLEGFSEHYRDELRRQKDYEGALWRGFYGLAEPLPALAAEKHERAYLDLAQRALRDAAKLHPPAQLHARAKLAESETAIATASRDIARWEQKQHLLADLRQLLKQQHGNVYREGKTLVARTRPDLLYDPQVAELLHQLPEAHRRQVRYVAIKDAPPPAGRHPAEATSLLIVNPTIGGAQKSGPAGRVVLALVRGVLYALDPFRGELRWARRIGVDATSLPVRLPATMKAPERFLVLSEDGKALIALDAASGKSRWRHALAAACPGRPVLVGDRAFLPMTTGRVDEVDTLTGRLLGYYELGEPLLGEGTVQPGTNLLYLPADSFSIYVLDVAARTCPAILYTGHPSGSLRSAPVVVSEPVLKRGFSGSLRDPARQAAKQDGSPGYLVLVQSDSLDTTLLRVYRVPIRQPEQKPLADGPPPLLGWSWSQPFSDSEKLALTTDAGLLTVFGIRQPGNHDPSLFPLVSASTPEGGDGSRSLLALVESGRYWTLLRGGLQKWQTGFFRSDGPRLVPRWPEPVALGVPLHAAQVRRDKAKGAVLFLVTQPPDKQVTLVSAVEARTGRILWQEQLGLLCDHPPVVLEKNVLALDRSGMLYLFEPGKEKSVSPDLAGSGRALGLVGGSKVLLFERGPDGAVYTLAGSNQGEPATFTLFRLSPGAGKASGKSVTPTRQQFSIKLPAPIAGTLALGPDCLLAPLKNGTLARHALTDGEALSGPNWRGPQADDDAPGHVVWAGGADYLVTDGGRTLRRFSWPADGNADERAAVELDRRIVTPPAVIQRGKDGVGLLVCVADAGGTLTLLQGPELTVARRWRLDGEITAGPFARAGRIGCIRNRRELFWFDPSRKKLAWKYQASADLVGQPLLTPAGVLVASLDGRFAALDPATGKARGPGYTLRANVAPTTTSALGEGGLLFVPLTDGTVLLLPADRLNKKL
jgi:outer membrane protein assembly factor BamB